MFLNVAAHGLVGDISVISNCTTKVVTEKKGMTWKLTSVYTAKKAVHLEVLDLFHKWGCLLTLPPLPYAWRIKHNNIYTVTRGVQYVMKTHSYLHPQTR